MKFEQAWSIRFAQPGPTQIIAGTLQTPVALCLDAFAVEGRREKEVHVRIMHYAIYKRNKPYAYNVLQTHITKRN